MLLRMCTPYISDFSLFDDVSKNISNRVVVYDPPPERELSSTDALNHATNSLRQFSRVSFRLSAQSNIDMSSFPKDLCVLQLLLQVYP